MISMTKTAAGAALFTTALAGAAAAERIAFNVWVPPSEVIVSDFYTPFFEALEETGDTKVQLFTAGQMLGPLNTMQGVRDGAVQGGMIDANYYGGELPYTATLGDFIAFAPDPVAGVGAVLETYFHHCPECLAEFEANNLIGLGGTATAPYTIMCSKEIESLDDLKGLRIRGSIDFHFAMVNALGANGVNVPFGEIAQAFERGNVDCLLGGPTWLEAFGIMELTKSRLSTVSFGSITLPGMMTFQRAAWDSWSEELRGAVLDAMPDYVASGTFAVLNDDAASAEKAHAAGVKEVDLGQAIVDLRDNFLVTERARLIESGTGRGAERTEDLLDGFVETYAEWEALSAEIGSDPDALAAALRARVYNADFPM